MAPPGYAPPRYSHDRIPTRLVNKKPPPPGTDTNGLAYALFLSFLVLAISLTAFVVANIRRSYRSRVPPRAATAVLRKRARVYVVLAIASLVAVWYYEVRYFRVSYLTWAQWRSYLDLAPERMHWGLWLRETSLFREKWETAVVGNARYWWTSQILVFACVLGVGLEQTGIRRGIKHTWAFMLLGQVISVAFATNLYLLSLLLSTSPPSPPPQSSTGTHRKKWLGPWAFSLLMIIFTEGPAHMLADEHYWFHQTDFLPMIITPHVALLSLPIARALLPGRFFADSSVEFAGTVHTYLWGATIFGGGLLFVRMTAMSYNYSGLRGIWDALFETPAVSSIAFDVIFCWVAWGVWLSIQERGPSDDCDVVEVKEEDGDMDEWTSASSRQIEPVGDTEASDMRSAIERVYNFFWRAQRRVTGLKVLIRNPG